MRSPNATLRLVRRLWFDVFHRPPRPLEVRASVGMPRDRLARAIVRRPEAMEQWVEEELWFHLLIDRFRPRTDAIAALPAALCEGTASFRDATAEILLSSAFSLRNPGNDTFVTVVLEQCLGLAVQDRRNAATLEAGKRLYDGRPARFLGRDGATQSDVVRFVVEHPDFARRRLDRARRRLLGAGLDALPRDDAAALVTRVHERPGAFFDVVAGWLGSDGYATHADVAKPKTERQFVRSLYVDVLGRTPSYDELRNVRNALQSMADSAPLRAVMVQLALAAPGANVPACPAGDEPRFVQTCFTTYLGRAPEQRELDAFAAILAEPGTTPRHVVRALLTSTEYGYC